jgi:hypothetical protein
VRVRCWALHAAGTPAGRGQAHLRQRLYQPGPREEVHDDARAAARDRGAVHQRVANVDRLQGRAGGQAPHPHGHAAHDRCC